MGENIVIEIRKEKNGVKVGTKEESNSIHKKRISIKLNSVKCKNELKDFINFQGKALVHFFKLSFYALALLGDSLVVLLNSLSKQRKKKKTKVKKEGFM